MVIATYVVEQSLERHIVQNSTYQLVPLFSISKGSKITYLNTKLCANLAENFAIYSVVLVKTSNIYKIFDIFFFPLGGGCVSMIFF